MSTLDLQGFDSLQPRFMAGSIGYFIGAALWRINRPARLAAMTSGVLSLMFLIALYFLILRPVPPRYSDVILADNAKSWRLPTGSIISYQEFLPPAGVAVKTEPIIFIHGGPGARFAPFDSDSYGSFAADGFRVGSIRRQPATFSHSTT
jgi:hypothetical protein